MVRHTSASEIAGAFLIRLAPRRFEERIEQAQRDFESVVGPMVRARGPAYSTRESPLPRPAPLRSLDPLFEVLPHSLATRYIAMRRDASMIARDLRGDRMPVARVTKPATSASTRYGTTADPHARRLRVRSITHETELARTFELEDPAGAPFPYAAGQFLVVRREVNGEALRRAYSLSSTPSSGVVSITVKRIEGGRASSSLVNGLKQGDWLDVTGPSGTFSASTPQAGARQVVLVAGGSGITPMRSIVHALLQEESETRVVLLYGNRSREDTLFRTELESLEHTYSGRFTLVQLRESGERTEGVLVGRPDEDTLIALFQSQGLARADLVLSCGPRPMMDALRGALGRLRFDLEKLREERFDIGRGEEPSDVEFPLEAQVEIDREGVTTRFVVMRGETLLDAAIDAGVMLPFSCQLGGCGACKVRLSEGDVVMEEPNCLSARERADGHVLTCVGRPKGAVKLAVLR